MSRVSMETQILKMEGWRLTIIILKNDKGKRELYESQTVLYFLL